jgi:hypothetical protein
LGRDSEEIKSSRVRAFFAKARELIENAWGNTDYGFKSRCMADLYLVMVKVLLDYNAPHQEITLWDVCGARINSHNLQLSDTEKKYETRPVMINPAKPSNKQNIQNADFMRITVLHEFGHLRNLHHPVCDGDNDRCYGITYLQKNDIMGGGSEITKRDYDQFIRILECYGRYHYPTIYNTWEPEPF